MRGKVLLLLLAVLAFTTAQQQGYSPNNAPTPSAIAYPEESNPSPTPGYTQQQQQTPSPTYQSQYNPSGTPQQTNPTPEQQYTPSATPPYTSAPYPEQQSTPSTTPQYSSPPYPQQQSPPSPSPQYTSTPSPTSSYQSATPSPTYPTPAPTYSTPSPSQTPSATPSATPSTAAIPQPAQAAPNSAPLASAPANSTGLPQLGPSNPVLLSVLLVLTGGNISPFNATKQAQVVTAVAQVLGEISDNITAAVQDNTTAFAPAPSPVTVQQLTGRRLLQTPEQAVQITINITTNSQNVTGQAETLRSAASNGTLLAALASQGLYPQSVAVLLSNVILLPSAAAPAPTSDTANQTAAAQSAASSSASSYFPWWAIVVAALVAALIALLVGYATWRRCAKRRAARAQEATLQNYFSTVAPYKRNHVLGAGKLEPTASPAAQQSGKPDPHAMPASASPGAISLGDSATTPTMVHLAAASGTTTREPAAVRTRRLTAPNQALSNEQV